MRYIKIFKKVTIFSPFFIKKLIKIFHKPISLRHPLTFYYLEMRKTRVKVAC